MINMTPSRTMKDIQKLFGRVATLKRFIFCNEHCLPFFKTLKNVSNFEWTSKCQQVLEELKLISPLFKSFHNLRKEKSFLFTWEPW
jgi:hypothetical protein